MRCSGLRKRRKVRKRRRWGERWRVANSLVGGTPKTGVGRIHWRWASGRLRSPSWVAPGRAGTKGGVCVHLKGKSCRGRNCNINIAWTRSWLVMSEFLHMMLSLGSSSPLGMWNCFPAHPSQFHAGWTLPLQAGGGSTGGEPVDGLGVPPGSHPGGPAPKEEFASIWKEKVAAAETATSTLHEHMILYYIYIIDS